MEKELEVIEVPASGRKDWGGGAYCIAFLYTKSKGNLIVKGYFKEVESYVKNNYTHYFVNFTLWSNGESRSIWSFWLDGYYIREPRRRKNKRSSGKTNYRWVLTGYSKHNREDLSFRRFPKRWIKEFDNLK